jgi:two-component system response regulator
LENLKEVEILLADDNPYDVELTLRALSKYKLANKIHVLNDGEKVLDYIFATGAYAEGDFSEKQKVVLLDLKLPKMDGLEVLQKVKSDDRTKKAPIVVLISSTQERDIVESYELDVNSYIIKPIDFDKFVKAVSDIGLYWMLLKQSTSLSTWEEYEV